MATSVSGLTSAFKEEGKAGTRMSSCPYLRKAKASSGVPTSDFCCCFTGYHSLQEKLKVWNTESHHLFIPAMTIARKWAHRFPNETKVLTAQKKRAIDVRRYLKPSSWVRF